MTLVLSFTVLGWYYSTDITTIVLYSAGSITTVSEAAMPHSLSPQAINRPVPDNAEDQARWDYTATSWKWRLIWLPLV